MLVSLPIRTLAGLLSLASLAACASDEGTYPSLARRPIERVSGTSDVVPAAPSAPLSPAPPSGELGALVAQAQAAHQRFVSRAGRTRQLVSAAAGAAMASESWSVATVALADLESARSEAMIALADLDALYAAQRVEGSDALATANARDSVIALVTEEDLILANLRGQVRS